jgi:uncharacterized protein
MDKQQLLSEIKKLVLQQEPQAEIILYGSYARGDYRPDSDMDILILLKKDIVSYFDEKRISYPLYELEIKTGQIISPLILPKKNWESKFKITPLYENVQKEGRFL